MSGSIMCPRTHLANVSPTLCYSVNFPAFHEVALGPRRQLPAPCIVGPHLRQAYRSMTMSLEPGYHNRKGHISTKISSLLLSLGNLPSKYEQIAPRVEYWIEYVLREQFTTVDELVEGVSPVAWRINSSNPNVVQFLKEFRDAPHRSEQARVFVDELCRYVLRWFAITATELIHNYSDSIASCGGDGFKRAASFVGQLVKNDLLSHDLARRHLIKPLITHNDDNDGDGDNDRVNAIYELFAAAGSTLLQGLIEPKDVQLSFQIMDKSSHLDKQKVKVHCTVRIVAPWQALTRIPGIP